MQLSIRERAIDISGPCKFPGLVPYFLGPKGTEKAIGAATNLKKPYFEY